MTAAPPVKRTPAYLLAKLQFAIEYAAKGKLVSGEVRRCRQDVATGRDTGALRFKPIDRP